MSSKNLQDGPVAVENAPQKSESVEEESKRNLAPKSIQIYKARKFYPGDIVIRKAEPQKWEWVPNFGTVMKPAVSPDQPGKFMGGFSKDFHVHWESTNRVEHTMEYQVNLADRLLLRNMRVENQEGLIGTVSNLKIYTTVQVIGTNHVVERVAIDRLRPITSFVRGQEIVYKDWVGVITVVKRNVWFLLDGGMGFYVASTETDGFMRNDPYWGVGVTCPGIRTKLSAQVMKSAKWVSGPMKFFSRWFPPLTYLYSMAHCTVNKAEVTEIEVKWLQVVPGVSNPGMIPKPRSTLSREVLRDVTIIGTPSSECVGINSVRMLKIRPEDALTSYTFWLDSFKKRYINEDENAETMRMPASSQAPLRALAAERLFEVPVKILHRQSIVDVTWNDGITSRIPAIKVASIVATKDDAEFPMGMVVASLYKSPNEGDRYGVVIESDALASAGKRKVNVKWIHNGNAAETTVESVFNLKPHETYSLYQRGTIVFPRNPGSMRIRSGVVSDLNIALGKMVIVITADNSQQEVFPHMVTPLPQRCFWNFFSRKWVIDNIIPPAYQLECEFDPSKQYTSVTEPTPEVLTTNNNNPEEPLSVVSLWDEPGFDMIGFAPETHRYYSSIAGSQAFGNDFISTVKKEFTAMKENECIPEGIWIRSYENRLDLLSVLMLGPTGTPFEDGVFMFDIQLPSNFPTKQPRVHYVSYTYEISPVMAWDGNFCVSSLDWNFVDGQPQSYIIHCLSQIQAYVFASEPYFCDVRKISEKDTAKGKDMARLYNEQTFLRVLDSSWNMIFNPHEPWTNLIKSHFSTILPEKLMFLENWHLSLSSGANSEETVGATTYKPDFPLTPVSEGFIEAFQMRLEKFRKIVQVPLPTQEPTVSSKSKSVTDTTADSESVPVDSGRKTPPLEIELVEKDAIITPNANDHSLVSVCDKTESHATPEAVIEKQTPDSVDSLKNVKIKPMRSRSKRKSGRKGKGQKKFSDSTSRPSTAGGTESEPNESAEEGEETVAAE